MVELVDTPDLKSCALWGVRVQVPLRVQNPQQKCWGFFGFKKVESIKKMATVYIHSRF